jgi:choline kinase/phosphatidylglycerophosphate synthase
MPLNTRARPLGADTGLAIEDVPAVILAAGAGSRIQSGNGGRPKPLTRFLGLTLIERTILSCRAAGINSFYVVVGHEKERVSAHAALLADRYDLDVQVIENSWWEEGIGTSALAAAPYVDGPFFLLMADHLFDPAIITTLWEAPRAAETSLLAVDRRTANVFDLDDATKVGINGDAIVAIDDDLDDYHAIDTGVFLCDPALFSALRLAQRRGDGSISGGMRELSQRGLAGAVDIGDRFWINVDTTASLAEARKRVVSRMPKGALDGPIAGRLNRPISIRISLVLAHTPVTPNMISLFSLLLALAGGALFGVGGYLWPLVAGLLVQAGAIIDGSDGEIARLKFRASPFGGWFDSVLDRYADLAIVAGITYAFWTVSPTPATLMAGLFTSMGFTMYSYTRKEYQVTHGTPLPERFPFILIPASRDVRVFIIFLGALVGLAFPAMILAGALSHLAVGTRLWASRPKRRRRMRTPVIINGREVRTDTSQSSTREPEGARTLVE